MAPILGFEDAIDIAIFIMMLGGLLKVIGKTGALEAGIKALVQKLKGREILLIPILMFIFSICGTTYGMLEETVGFYALLAATMMAAGMDPLVGSAVILLGAGAGCLGSTINPFATGVAISALPDSIKANQGVVILIAVFLWLTTYAICTFFVVRYAKKVKRDKGSTFLSLREQKAAEKKYGSFEEHEENSKKEQEKVVLNVTDSSMSDIQKAKALHDWLCNAVDYDDTNTKDAKNHVDYSAFLYSTTVCDGYARAYQHLMQAANIESYNIGSQTHAWNMIKLGNHYFHVDVTWDDPVGGSPEYIDHSYFNISDSDMAIDHTWTSDFNETNPANGYIYTYPVQAKLHSAGTQYELDRYILRCIKSRSQHIEFTTTNDLDIKSAVSSAGVQLSYSYKTTIRNNYTMYSVTFSY